MAQVVEVGTPGSLIGLFTDVTLSEVGVLLQPGDVLVLHTDGVIEARSGPDTYGEDRLRGVVGAGAPSAGALADAIVDDVVLHERGHTSDDVAVVVLRAC